MSFRIISGVRHNILLTPIAALLSIASSVLIARVLGPTTYADYATLLAVSTWFLLLAESGCNAGLGRYWNEAGMQRARRTLYVILQKRRWVLAMILMVALSWAGPYWAEKAGLAGNGWNAITFVLVGLLSAVMLHSQLTSIALAANFNHARMHLVNGSISIIRALTLCILVALTSDPVALVVALLAVAVVEAFLNHRAGASAFWGEKSELPGGMANAAQLHGGVSLADKLATAFSGAPFLILILAGSQGRTDLAMLAVAADLLQKILAVVAMPISNLVLPILNESRSEPERYRRHVLLFGELMTLLFAFSAAGVAAVVPLGVPMLLGAEYEPAVVIALIWLIPLFFESGVRMVWGAAVLTLGHYRWYLGFNALSALVYAAVVFLWYEADLVSLILVLGIARMGLSAIFLMQATALNLNQHGYQPIRVILAAIVACALSWGTQSISTHAGGAQFFFGLLTYIVAASVLLRWVPLITDDCYGVLRRVAGKHHALLLYVLPNRPEEHQSAQSVIKK